MSAAQGDQTLELALANLGVWNLDLTTGTAVVSERLARILGRDRSSDPFNFGIWDELLHPDDRQRVHDHWDDFLREDAESDYEDEYRVRSASGGWIWVFSRIGIVDRGPEGQPLRVLGTLSDISARKESEAALHSSETRYRALVEGSPLGIVEIDREGRLVDASEALLALVGAPSVEALREEFHALDGPRLTRAGIADAMRRCLEEGEQGTLEATWESRWGRPLQVRVHYAPLRADGDGGVITGAGGFVEDVTERRLLEAQVQQARKLESLAVGAGGIAHDFNNLLGTILGNANLALLRLPQAVPVRRHLDDIVTAVNCAADLCNQMLTYAGEREVATQAVDLTAVVKEMIALLDVSVSDHAELRYEFEPDLPAIEADATPLRQIVMNLILNASEALGEEAGIVRVGLRSAFCDGDELAACLLGDGLPAGRYVILDVSDTGAGMDEETRQRIFDPFYTTKVEGRGLGLAAILGIVRVHRGAIRLRSKPGRGSTFSVLLPASEPAPQKTQFTEAQPRCAPYPRAARSSSSKSRNE